MKTKAHSPRYQVLPPLQPGTYVALRADIERHGVLVAIEIDEEGEILDGHNRKAIADELGLECPTVVRRGLTTNEEKLDYALRVNVLRRQLGPVEWAAMFSRLAEIRGIRLRIPGRQRADTVSALAAELGVDSRTARRRLRLAETLFEHPDLAARVDAGTLDAKRAERIVRDRLAETRREQAKPHKRTQVGSGIDIRYGSFEERLADLAPSSVDLVLTDPPWAWDDETVELWDHLGSFCARVLKEGRALVAYSGSGSLGAAMERLSRHLDYVFAGSLPVLGPHAEVPRVLAVDLATPIVFYSKGIYRPRHWFKNAVASPHREKEFHPWQRPLANVAYYLERFSEPGELVCDPFLGGGTTAVAARDAGRRFVGCDVDPLAVEVSLKRLKDTDASEASVHHLEPGDAEP